jgi:hypothetical protein
MLKNRSNGDEGQVNEGTARQDKACQGKVTVASWVRVNDTSEHSHSNASKAM